MKYWFQELLQCNMCGSPTNKNKILGRRLNKPQGLRPKKRDGIATTVIKCTHCGLIYCSPLPVPEDLRAHYSVEPDEYWHADYFVAQTDYFKDQISSFRELYGNCEESRQLRALDIGAGIGRCIRALLDSGFDAYGIEPSETFYAAATANTRIPNAKITLGRVEEAEFEHNFFDFITFSAVLEHLYDPSDAISRALMWLKPDGLIHAEVPSSSWLVSRLGNLFYRITGTDSVANLSPMHAPYHLYEFTLSSFKLNGVQNGYTTVHHQYHVCQTYMPRFVDPLLRRVMRATNTGMQLEVWLRKRPLSHPTGNDE